MLRSYIAEWPPAIEPARSYAKLCIRDVRPRARHTGHTHKQQVFDWTPYKSNDFVDVDEYIKDLAVRLNGLQKYAQPCNIFVRPLGNLRLLDACYRQANIVEGSANETALFHRREMRFEASQLPLEYRSHTEPQRFSTVVRAQAASTNSITTKSSESAMIWACNDDARLRSKAVP